MEYRLSWFAAWNMELKEQPKTIVGDFCFKGITDDGMVEIGYGLKEGPRFVLEKK